MLLLLRWQKQAVGLVVVGMVVVGGVQRFWQQTKQQM